jgi:FtsZ-interacting cell division protein ZipA
MDSSTVTLIAIVVAVIIVVAILFLAMRKQQSARLRSRFGPEYERTVDDVGDRQRAEHELHERQKRVSRFEIRPLSASERDHFIASWHVIQAEFVDQPRQALAKADDLLTEVMRVRGYPMETFEQRSADLSVDHPSVVQHYRAGREIAVRHKQGDAGTEDLRQAMIHYRALFDELVSEPAADVRREA